MIVAQWKEMILNAAAILEAWPYLMDESAEYSRQTMQEYLNILTEKLPGLDDRDIEKMFSEAEEYDIDPNMASFDSLYRELEAIKSDEEYEEVSIRIIEQAISLLMQV